MPNRSVLVCDDNPLLLDLLDFKLGARGYEVRRATDGLQALDQLAKRLPDVVVLDAMMPGIDGFEVLRRIKEDDGLRSVPVIMLTARKQERDIVTALGMGASDYLGKPFSPEELVARIDRVLPSARTR